MAKQTADTISAPAQAPQKIDGGSALPKTAVESIILVLSNDKRKGHVSLDIEEDTIDPDTGKDRRMRVFRGAPSIWFDEQPVNVYPQKDLERKMLTLNFDRGICLLPVREPLLIKAARASMRNVANQKKYKERARPKDIYFYEWNPTEQNEQTIKDEQNVMKAMQLAFTTPIEEIIPHAKYLNVPFQDEMGVPLDEQALRVEYAKKAKNDSKRFLESLHTPVVKMSHMVRTAIDKGLIDLGKQPGAAYWTDGGFISQLPEGRDAVDYLIEFAMTFGEANTTFANQLREFST